METKQHSFWSLINVYRINIPTIQRDYAQGRIEEKEKRDKFLNAIFISLTENSALDLDFVYGRVDKNTFYPIDGQQRLTTLFLLHWYIGQNEKIDENSKSVLKRFVYDTRISSREFCEAIIDETDGILEKIENVLLSDYIQNQYWFKRIWKKDPTINAMLVMIQAIHEKFRILNSNSIWEKLTTEALITFKILDLGSKGFELTDELYIKMNARGKQLASFENFKANFIQFIDKAYPDKKCKHPLRGSISYSGYFSYRIEKEWMDLFWSFRGHKATVDLEFSNYFEFIAQMCFFKDNPEAKADDFNASYIQYEKIFKNEDNLIFLFNSFDKIYEIFQTNKQDHKDNIQNFFLSIVQNPNSHKSERVNTLFWNKEISPNLLEGILLNVKNEEARNKILLFAILYYLIKHNLSHADESLISFVRLLRNLFQSTRQRMETKYNTNVRLNSFGYYWKLFEQLSTKYPNDTILNEKISNKGTQISDSSLQNEFDKAEMCKANPSVISNLLSIEEHIYFGGMLHQLKPLSNLSKLKNYERAIYEIWNDSVKDSLKIQALIACGFEGFKVRETKMGQTRYFGKIGKWETILTNEDASISDSIIKLLDTYSELSEAVAEEKLRSIVSNWLSNHSQDRSWKYYFLKYSEFTTGLNYYVWPEDYEISMLGTEGINPLVAYHISPFVFTTCVHINNESICSLSDCYLQYSGNAPLKTKKGIQLTSIKDGWLVSASSKIQQFIIDKYQLQPTDKGFLLKETNQKDRIEIAIELINDVG